MAEILIKNMKKPKDCWDCPLKTTWHTPNGLHGCCGMVPSLNFQPYQKPFDDCPLVEVPPHGRLGDLTRFVEDIINSESLKNEFTSYQLTLLRQLAKNAPSIIEAST